MGAPEGFEIFEGSIDERDIFGGMTAKEMAGRKPEDPLTSKQRAMIFALGKDMGMTKDDIKDTYMIESISDLTIKGAGDIIDQMLIDTGQAVNLAVERAGEAESKLLWQKQYGIDMMGDSFAKCGHCRSFSGISTLASGHCEKKIFSGTKQGKEVIPLTQGCFISKYADKPVLPGETSTPKDDSNGKVI